MGTVNLNILQRVFVNKTDHLGSLDILRSFTVLIVLTRDAEQVNDIFVTMKVIMMMKAKILAPIMRMIRMMK